MWFVGDYLFLSRFGQAGIRQCVTSRREIFSHTAESLTFESELIRISNAPNPPLHVASRANPDQQSSAFEAAVNIRLTSVISS